MIFVLLVNTSQWVFSTQMREIKMISPCDFSSRRLPPASSEDDISCLYKSHVATASTGMADNTYNYHLKVLNNTILKNYIQRHRRQFYSNFCQFKTYTNWVYEVNSYFMVQVIAASNLDLGIVPDYSWFLFLFLSELLMALKVLESLLSLKYFAWKTRKGLKIQQACMKCPTSPNNHLV